MFFKTHAESRMDRDRSKKKKRKADCAVCDERTCAGHATLKLEIKKAKFFNKTDTKETQATTPRVEREPDVERLDKFRQYLLEIFTEGHTEQVPLDRILAEINHDRSEPFDKDEVMDCINKMMEENQVYLDIGTRDIFLI